MPAPQRPQKKKFAAIDPGCSGGIAWQGNGAIVCMVMPETEGDIVNAIKTLFCEGIEEIWMEEIVGFIPKAAPGAMFTFGKNYGFIKGVIMALGIRLVTVKPKVWQKALALGDKKSYGKEWKNHLKAKAQELFPQTYITLKTSDALLILEYVTKYGQH